MKTSPTLQKSGITMLAFVILLGVSGCKTSVNSVERAEPTGQKTMVADERVLTDPSLSRFLRIIGVNEAMTPGGVLRVQIELVNRSRKLKSFNYQFQWFDADGMQFGGTASALMSAHIEGGDTLFLSGVAPHPKCQDFRIRLIESKN